MESNTFGLSGPQYTKPEASKAILERSRSAMPNPIDALDETGDDDVPAAPREATIPGEFCGSRLDQALSRLFPAFSRNRLKGWIESGDARVDGAVWRPRDKVQGGERVTLTAVMENQVECRPEAIELNVVFEDDDILVVDKPAGLVVHPAAGNWSGTLQNGLLHHAPGLIQVPRAGIVHRLDKDTSGLLVVAKTLPAHTALVAQLQARSMKREYLAVISGLPVAGNTVDAPIGRHPTQRTRMAVTPGGKPAVTHFRVAERFRAHCLLEVRLETGRTHQIRVHLAHLHYPIVGDPVYGGRLRLPKEAGEALIETLRGFRRQALHAARLSLEHPATGETMRWQSGMPADMRDLVEVLRADLDGA
jgi:23S rRNA pseudouridine1911/1915/1917 synthase